MSSKLRVMQVITKGESGGAQAHLRELCRAVAGRVDMTVAIGGALHPTRLGRDLELLGVPVDAVPHLTNSMRPWRVISAVSELLRLLRERQPQIVHAHSGVAGAVGRIAGRIAGIPVIYTVHGFGFKSEVPLTRRCAAAATEWALAPLASHMVCVSAAERQLAARLPISDQNVSVVRNALADSQERATPETEPLKIAMVARFAAPKRHDLLLEALALLRDRRGRQIEATLIGDGPDLQPLVRLAGRLRLDAVHFPGEVHDVPQRLAAHSAFVLMSDHEGLPISVIEAMRAGLPIVASDLPGLREMVRSGDEGLLVPNDPTVLAAALAQLADSGALRRNYGTAARRRYEDEFQSSLMAETVLSLYARGGQHE